MKLLLVCCYYYITFTLECDINWHQTCTLCPLINSISTCTILAIGRLKFTRDSFLYVFYHCLMFKKLRKCKSFIHSVVACLPPLSVFISSFKVRPLFFCIFDVVNWFIIVPYWVIFIGFALHSIENSLHPIQNSQPSFSCLFF